MTVRFGVAGATHLWQPIDAGVGAKYKQLIAKYYRQWMMTAEADEFMESGNIPVETRRLLLARWVWRAWLELETARQELARDGRETDSIFYKAFLRTGALRRDSGQGDEEIRMKSSCNDDKEWYKTLSQEIPEEEEKSCAQKKKAGKKRGGAKRSRSGQKKGEIDVELESEGEADEDIQSHPASSSVFSDDDSNSDIDMDVRDMTSEELYSPFLFFDRPVQDNYRARVADEYSRLVCEAKRAGRNTNSTRVIDELELLANKNVTDSDNQAKQVAVGGRPVRQAARQALGHDFYSELHYFGQ